MKLINDYVEIRNKNKTISLKNLILNNYLHTFINNIIDSGNTPQKQYFHKCYIKLTDTLSFNTTSQIVGNSFDFWFENPIIYESPSVNSSTINYLFKSLNGRVYSTETYKSIEETVYKGKKITAIGFFTEDNSFAGAVLDVSNFDMYYDEGFSIIRQDTIKTDAMFISKGQLATPKHLLFMNDNITSYLKAIGLGMIKDEIQQRYNVIATDYSSRYTDKQYVEFSILKDDGGTSKIPNFSSMCKSFLPMYLSKYPTRNNFKYIMFIYEATYEVNEKKVTAEYWEVMDINVYGKLKLTIKYERN